MPKTGDSSTLNAPLITAEDGGAGSSGVVTRSKEPTQTFEFSEDGLTDEQVVELRTEWGPNTLPENKKSKLMLLFLAFTSPMAILIWVGIIVELVVGLLKLSEGLKGAEGPTEDLVDFGVLLLLQFMNAFVGWHEECKAGDAVAALKKSLAPKANVKRNGRWVVIPGVDLVPGDLVVLALGGAVPADCRLLAGKEIGVDQAALTGESLPVKMREGDVAKMGSCVATGEIEAVVVATGGNTFFGKTAALLNSVDESSNLDKVLLQVVTPLPIPRHATRLGPPAPLCPSLRSLSRRSLSLLRCVAPSPSSRSSLRSAPSACRASAPSASSSACAATARRW